MGNLSYLEKTEARHHSILATRYWGVEEFDENRTS